MFAIVQSICDWPIYYNLTMDLQVVDRFAIGWPLCYCQVSLQFFFLYICDWNLLIKLQFNFLIYLQLADLFIIGRSRCNFHSSCNWPTCLQLFDLFAIDRSIFNWTIDLQGVDRFAIGRSLCDWVVSLQLASLFDIFWYICNWPICLLLADQVAIFWSICNWLICF